MESLLNARSEPAEELDPLLKVKKLFSVFREPRRLPCLLAEKNPPKRPSSTREVSARILTDELFRDRRLRAREERGLVRPSISAKPGLSLPELLERLLPVLRVTVAALE